MASDLRFNLIGEANEGSTQNLRVDAVEWGRVPCYQKVNCDHTSHHVRAWGNDGREIVSRHKHGLVDARVDSSEKIA